MLKLVIQLSEVMLIICLLFHIINISQGNVQDDQDYTQCGFNTLETFIKIHNSAGYFQRKYFTGVSPTDGQQIQQEYYHDCDEYYGECNFRFRLVDEEKVDDLNEFYKLDGSSNEFVTISGQYRRGRHLKMDTTRKFTQFMYSKIRTGFEFIDDKTLLDDLSYKNFTIGIDSLNDEDDVINGNLPNEYKSYLVDLISFRRKAIAFVQNVEKTLKNTYYYHYTTDIDTNLHFIYQDHEIREKKKIFKDGGQGKTDGGYYCGKLSQAYEINNKRLTITGEPIVVLFGANSIPAKTRYDLDDESATEFFYTDY